MESNALNYFKFAAETIRGIKEFSGECSSELPKLFRQVESVVPILDNFDVVHKKLLFESILNKCTGKCMETLQREKEVSSWAELKVVLKKHFGEEKSMTDLMDELKSLTVQGTIEKYYNEINAIITRLNNKRLTNDDGLYSAEEISRISLRTFRDRMPEPTKSMLFTRNPRSLEEAYSLIKEAGQQYFTSRRGNNYRNQNGNRWNQNRRFQDTSPNNNVSQGQYYNRNHGDRDNFQSRNFNRNNNNNEQANIQSRNIRQGQNTYNNYGRGFNNNNNSNSNSNTNYRTNSQNTRRTNASNSWVPPMQIGQNKVDFRRAESGNYLI